MTSETPQPPNLSEEQVKIAARLYECRDAARFIFGASYTGFIKPWRTVIAKEMEARRTTVLQAALALGKQADNESMVMLIVAAAVEMLDHPENSDVVAGAVRQ